MLNTDTTTARQDVDLFHRLLDEKGFNYDILWHWEGGSTGRRGANRDGVLCVYDRKWNRLFRVQFERSSVSWGPGDVALNRVHTGSNRHRAVMEAIDTLKDMQRRQLCGQEASTRGQA